MVEGTPLLREHAVKNCIKGSNPFVSARGSHDATPEVAFFIGSGRVHACLDVPPMSPGTWADMKDAPGATSQRCSVCERWDRQPLNDRPMKNRGTWMMGEAGPEANIPLRRHSNGMLGIDGGGQQPTTFGARLPAKGSQLIPGVTPSITTIDGSFKGRHRGKYLLGRFFEFQMSRILSRMKERRSTEQNLPTHRSDQSIAYRPLLS